LRIAPGSPRNEKVEDEMISSAASYPRRVAVTAIGIVSPLGLGCDETTEALRAGRDAVAPVTAFDVSKTRCKTAGLVDADALRARLGVGASRHDRQRHVASLMMMSAAREVREADQAFDPEILVIGTTSGGMSFGEAFYRAQVQKQRPHARAAWLANYLPQKPVLDAEETWPSAAPSQIIANACASGTNAVGHAFRLIRGGLHQRVLCGGYDAISEMVFVGFDSLQASTPEKIRPFDKERSGLVLGEGAALLALEEMESARRRGAPIIAEITGYGISTDNHHLTQPHPSGIGPRQAMERALADARRAPGDVDYINAHGTATIFNDATEGTAARPSPSSLVTVCPSARRNP
jgi:3-oxoacyl-[acyl-carrier-protein] synthase II